MHVNLLQIETDAEAVFVARPNRFLGIVDISTPEKAGNIEVHVHDPGRLTDLLYPGNRVLIRRAANPKRKTHWDLIAAQHEEEWILVHAGFHRSIVSELIEDEIHSPFGKIAGYTPEVTVGHSRLDYRIDRVDGSPVWVEVKGCTMCEDGIAMFPDAPTVRGTRHLETLINLKKRDEQAAILFLVFRPEARCFAANGEIDALFAATLEKAEKHGIDIFALKFAYRDGLVVCLGRLPLSS